LGSRHDTGWVVWLVVAGTIAAGLASWRLRAALRR
jgi:hypothetical protein